MSKNQNKLSKKIIIIGLVIAFTIVTGYLFYQLITKFIMK